jgi:DNA-binding XRE family transcriptional regulator
MSTQSKQLAELDKIKEMRKEAEFDKHLAQTVQVRLPTIVHV